MTPFDQLIDDVFANTDFVETAVIGGETLPVIAGEISEEERLTRFGLDEGLGFFLRLKFSDADSADRNASVTFRGEEYIIAKRTIDSAGLSVRIDLQSKSSR